MADKPSPKTDALRAMREQRYAEQQKRAAAAPAKNQKEK